MFSGHKVVCNCHFTIFVVATPSRHWGLTIFRLFSCPCLFPEAVLHCRVVAVAKLKNCRVPSSAFLTWTVHNDLRKEQSIVLVDVLSMGGDFLFVSGRFLWRDAEVGTDFTLSLYHYSRFSKRSFVIWAAALIYKKGLLTSLFFVLPLTLTPPTKISWMKGWMAGNLFEASTTA